MDADNVKVTLTVRPGLGIVPDRERCPKCWSFAKRRKAGGLQRHTTSGKKINGATKGKPNACEK